MLYRMVSTLHCLCTQWTHRSTGQVGHFLRKDDSCDITLVIYSTLYYLSMAEQLQMGSKILNFVGSQKVLGVPPGTAPISFSPRAVQHFQVLVDIFKLFYRLNYIFLLTSSGKCHFIPRMSENRRKQLILWTVKRRPSTHNEVYSLMCCAPLGKDDPSAILLPGLGLAGRVLELLARQR